MGRGQICALICGFNTDDCGFNASSLMQVEPLHSLILTNPCAGVRNTNPSTVEPPAGSDDWWPSPNQCSQSPMHVSDSCPTSAVDHPFSGCS